MFDLFVATRHSRAKSMRQILFQKGYCCPEVFAKFHILNRDLYDFNWVFLLLFLSDQTSLSTTAMNNILLPDTFKEQQKNAINLATIKLIPHVQSVVINDFFKNC